MIAALFGRTYGNGVPFGSAAAASTPYAKEESCMSKSLRIALIHMDVHYKEPEFNRQRLIILAMEAILKGADIILTPELPVTGYSFSSREDISDYVETEEGATVEKLAVLAKEYSKYIGIGLAERGKDTGIYYNSAVMIGPDGTPVCKYRKINAENRWACPGDPKQAGVFDTPWGRMGILICSDTYYGLSPRSMALKGVELLWVPANWPPGGIDPEEVWRARVLENGYYLAACNRTGRDRIMDCRKAISCVYSPSGVPLFSGSSEDSRVFIVDLPLDEWGKLTGVLRRQRIEDRTPSVYGAIYRNLHPAYDLTDYYDLPNPGPLQVHCVVPEEENGIVDRLEKEISNLGGKRPALFVLPPISQKTVAGAFLLSVAKRRAVALCTTFIGSDGGRTRTMWTADGKPAAYLEASDDGLSFPVVHYGPAKIAMAPIRAFVHPELAVSFSKLGCDLVVLSEESVNDGDRLLCSVKTIEGLAVAVCARNGGFVAMVPRGHEHWEERSLEGQGTCSFEIDTGRTRNKHFQDRQDYELLLENSTPLIRADVALRV